MKRTLLGIHDDIGKSIHSLNGLILSNNQGKMPGPLEDGLLNLLEDLKRQQRDLGDLIGL